MTGLSIGVNGFVHHAKCHERLLTDIELDSRKAACGERQQCVLKSQTGVNLE